MPIQRTPNAATHCVRSSPNTSSERMWGGLIILASLSLVPLTVQAQTATMGSAIAPASLADDTTPSPSLSSPVTPPTSSVQRDASFMAPIVVTGATPQAAPPPLLGQPVIVQSTPPQVTPTVSSPPAPLASRPVSASGIPQTTPSPSASLPPQNTPDPVNAESIGLTTVATDGLAADLWQTASFIDIKRLIATLSLPTSSAALNDVLRRAFRTTATVPLPTATDTQKTFPSFMSQRITALSALGATDDAWKLLALAKPDLVDGLSRQQITEMALLGSSGEAVCTSLTDSLKKESISLDEQAMLTLCQLRSNNVAAAQLSLDLLRNDNYQDTTFLNLADRALQKSTKALPRASSSLRPVTVALLGMAPSPLVKDYYTRLAPALIPSLIALPTTDESARLLLAERGLMMGVIDAQDIRKLYRDQSFPQTTLASGTPPINLGESQTRAFWYQVGLNDKDPINRINALLRIVLMNNKALLPALAPVLSDMVAGITPLTDYGKAAPYIASILAMTDRKDATAEWFAMAERAAIGIPVAAESLRTVWPILAMTQQIKPADWSKKLSVWVEDTLSPTNTSDQKMARETVARALLFFDALGLPVGEGHWLRVMDNLPPEKHITPTSPLLTQRLQSSAQASRKGEAIITAALLTNTTEPSDWGQRLAIVRALSLMNMKNEAIQLALELWTAMPPIASPIKQ